MLDGGAERFTPLASRAEPVGCALRFEHLVAGQALALCWRGDLAQRLRLAVTGVLALPSCRVIAGSGSHTFGLYRFSQWRTRVRTVQKVKFEQGSADWKRLSFAK